MSKLEQLLIDFCPNGVEHACLADVARISNGRDHKHLSDGDIPVYGSGGIMRYADQCIYDKESVLIPRKGSIGNIFYVNTPFWTVDTIFYTKVSERIFPKFLYYYLTMVHVEDLNEAGGVPSLTKTVLDKVRVAIPPLPVQSEIIKILDNFTELTAELTVELTAELTARKKQYEYYRNELLTFSDDVPMISLGEIADVRDGTHDSPKETIKGKQLVTSKNIRYGQIDLSTAYFISDDDYESISKRSKVDKWDVLMSMIGTIGEVALVTNEPEYAIKNIGLIKCGDELKARFISHYLKSGNAKRYMSKNKSKGSQAFLGLGKLRSFPIPFPPLGEQARIVDILDKFDVLNTDISNALPAEIEARRKQYEYYRDKLLTFKELEA